LSRRLVACDAIEYGLSPRSRGALLGFGDALKIF